MRYGVHVHNFGPYSNPRYLAELAHEAEEAGWDGFFVCDHLTARAAERGPEPVANPWIALAAIAVATQRVLLGPLVAALPRRRPWQLASEVVTLDQLSGGRVILGVGSGTGLQNSFEPFHEEMNLRTRADLLDESLDVLAGLWSGEPFSYQGKHFQPSRPGSPGGSKGFIRPSARLTTYATRFARGRRASSTAGRVEHRGDRSRSAGKPAIRPIEEHADHQVIVAANCSEY